MQRRTFLTAALAAPSLAWAAGPSLTVLELFTSQGCSSCPPADALLGQLAQRPDTIAMAWHVDYWNYLGWKDPYADKRWTERQRDYARHLRGEVYTPAMVVNGATMLVGSDGYGVTQAMAHAAPLPAPVSLRRTATGLEAAIGSAPAGATALLVIYDPENATAVRAGENAGRQLKEYRIVREVRDVPVSAGSVSLAAVGPTQGAALLLRDAAWRLIGAADAKI